MIRVWWLVLGLALLGGPAHAQEVSPLVKYGKWVLVAGSAAMNYLAIQAHNDAEDTFDELEDQCNGAQSRCAVGPDGSYLDPAIEDLYQQTLQHDQAARAWLIGGETALLGAGVLFVWELTRPKGRPDNIPFEPEVRSMRGGTGLGLRINF